MLLVATIPLQTQVSHISLIAFITVNNMLRPWIFAGFGSSTFGNTTTTPNAFGGGGAGFGSSTGMLQITSLVDITFVMQDLVSKCLEAHVFKSLRIPDRKLEFYQSRQNE